MWLWSWLIHLEFYLRTHDGTDVHWRPTPPTNPRSSILVVKYVVCSCVDSKKMNMVNIKLRNTCSWSKCTWSFGYNFFGIRIIKNRYVKCDYLQQYSFYFLDLKSLTYYNFLIFQLAVCTRKICIITQQAPKQYQNYNQIIYTAY